MLVFEHILFRVVGEGVRLFKHIISKPAHQGAVFSNHIILEVMSGYFWLLLNWHYCIICEVYIRGQVFDTCGSAFSKLLSHY